MSLNDADGMANSEDPDLGAVWSGSALFAQACLSENLGSLRYSGLDISHFVTHTFYSKLNFVYVKPVIFNTG